MRRRPPLLHNRNRAARKTPRNRQQRQNSPYNTGMKYDMPEEVNSDADGFRALAELRARVAKQKSGEIEINMERTTWVSPQMCAPFGAILYEMEEAANTVRITNIVAEDVKETFSQNKFPYYHGGETKPEQHESHYSNI